ncbi:H-NS histone family protein [Lampropedia aestuarii]|uniref:H-NS histone family protein n=1 Tax=Lampropedia aestuarii TaxID=2562762 RepID=A0A4S5BHZ6_9BURK|nr:H-NS histone family protein [Lampropedia aestuarii]MDH5858379.1 H-NS histone family protein [Lampropedia aestuarii]THJ32024.1 H-NS histone family protein [Lampropedia aestuarii]
MAQLDDLIQQREALDQQINAMRQQARTEALTQIQSLIQQFELTPSDIFSASKNSKSSASAGKKVAIKYLNKATGESWTGRGKPPRWIQGQDREAFKV